MVGASGRTVGEAFGSGCLHSSFWRCADLNVHFIQVAAEASEIASPFFQDYEHFQGMLSTICNKIRHNILVFFFFVFF